MAVPPPAPPSGSTASANSAPLAGARTALILLLAINLFNYIDRQVLSAVLPKLELDGELFSPSDPDLKFKLGLLTTAFLVTYMLLSPVFGWMGDKRSRWWLIGIGVILWSLASGGSGLAVTFLMLLVTRCLVGVGEAAYGPVAPSMISDLYPVERRGRTLAWFYMAIPVGSALGFVIGGQIASTAWGWRGAFLVVVIPGLILGAICFFMREPPREKSLETKGFREYLRVLPQVLRVPSFRYCTAGMTLTTFVLGGVAAWVPYYIFEREARFQLNETSVEKMALLKTTTGEPVVPPAIVAKLRVLIAEDVLSSPQLKKRLEGALNEKELAQYQSRIFDESPARDSATLGGINLIFGAIVVLAGLFATLLGGIVGDRLRTRMKGAYFQVAGWGVLASVPFFIAMLYVPFPFAWVMIFIAVFGLFFNTGPANTILANVTHPSLRATAFALNILIIHLLGDAISPPLIGLVADFSSLHVAFLLISGFLVAGGALWVWGARFLDADTQNASTPSTAHGN